MMEDKKLKELLQKAEVETSDAFMDNLMNKIEAIDATETDVHIPYMVPLLILGGLLIVTALLILKFSTSATAIFKAIDFSIEYPLTLIASLFLILSANKFIKLKASLGKNQFINKIN